MKHINIIFLILFSNFLFKLNICKSQTYLISEDNFESDSLSNIWRKDKFVSGAFSNFEILNKDKKKSGKFVLKSGDQIEKEKGTIYERAELKEIKKIYSVDDTNYEYKFSLYLPQDFPIVSTRLVIAQWKQNCSTDTCSPDNPVIALRYNNGIFHITTQSNFIRDTLFLQTQSILGQWLDFEFKIRFSSNSNGRILGILNNKQIIAYKGPTAYSESNGDYRPPNSYYFKFGLYRDICPETMTIYVDNYSKSKIKKL